MDHYMTSLRLQAPRLTALLLTIALLATGGSSPLLAAGSITKLEFADIEEKVLTYNPDILKNKENYFQQVEKASEPTSSSTPSSDPRKGEALDLLTEALTGEDGAISESDQSLLDLLTLMISPDSASGGSGNSDDSDDEDEDDDDSSSSSNSSTASLSLSTTKSNYSIVWNAQNTFFNYYNLKLTLEDAENKQKELEFAYYAATIKKNLGQITAQTLEDAKTQMDDGQESISSLREQLAKALEEFNLLLGQDADTALQLGTLPTVTADSLRRIDRDKAFTVAAAQSFEIRQLKTATHSKKDLENTTRSFKKSFDTVYDDVLTAVEAYEKACAQTGAALKAYELNAKKYERGLINRADWLQAENSYRSVKLAELKADYAMYKSYVRFSWALRGLIVQ